MLMIGVSILLVEGPIFYYRYVVLKCEIISTRVFIIAISNFTYYVFFKYYGLYELCNTPYIRRSGGDSSLR